VITPLVRMEVFVLVSQTRSLHSLVLLVLSYPILSEYPFFGSLRWIRDCFFSVIAIEVKQSRLPRRCASRNDERGVERLNDTIQVIQKTIALLDFSISVKERNEIMYLAKSMSIVLREKYFEYFLIF
jgi:ABC-type protease/lipase transport system fused ATPase/permease subunit